MTIIDRTLQWDRDSPAGPHLQEKGRLLGKCFADILPLECPPPFYHRRHFISTAQTRRSKATPACITGTGCSDWLDYSDLLEYNAFKGEYCCPYRAAYKSRRRVQGNGQLRNHNDTLLSNPIGGGFTFTGLL